MIFLSFIQHFRSICQKYLGSAGDFLLSIYNFFQGHLPPPPHNIIPSLFMILNLTLLSVVWQTCSWTDQDSEAQTRYQLISLWCRVHRSHAQCWMDYWQWLGWAKNYAISKLDTCSIVLGISLCFGGRWRLIIDITSKRDYILTVHILIGESLQGGSSIFQEGMTGTLGVQNQWGMLPKCYNVRIGT